MGTGFQGRRSNKKSFLLSSCSSWVIAALSSLWFIQASSLRAMEPEEPVRRSVKSGGKKDSVNSNGFYKDSEHPQTAEFWKTKDLSKRLEKIKLCISEIQEKITNYKTNEINITSEEIEKYKNFFKCNQSDPIFIQDLGDITFDNLLWESDPTHTMAGGWSAAKVAVLKCENSKIKIAIKKFQTKDLKIGLEELLYSLIALNINPSPEEIKMARIWDAAITCENSNECLNIIMECANGEDIHKILSKDSSSTNFSSNAIKACAEYLAIFHIRNYEKLNKETNREKYLLYAAKPFNTLVYDPLKGDENKSLFPLFVKKPLSEIDEQLSDFEQIKPDHVLRLLSPDDQEKFIYFAKRSRDQFEENASEIYRAIQCWGMQKEKSYFLTLTHGDAHGNNFFYDDNKNLTHKGKDIPKDSFYRVAMIDFASSIKTYGDIGDPAEDVGRFLGSLWDWAAKQDGPLCEHYEKIWNLQEQFIQFYMKKIEASGIFKEKNKKIFERVFKENYNFYKLRFYKIIANAKKDQESEKDKDIKKKVLEYWIKENAALDSSFQEKPKKIIVRKESKERDWEPAPTVQKKSIHFIPQESTVFIESADEEGSYLTRLWGMLRDKRNVTLSSRAAIAGMGGVGKTSLALEYAHEAFRNRAYNLIYWIPCGSELSLINGYKNLLLEMGIPIKNVDNERLIDLVKWKVPKWGKCLLIYDNVTDPSLLTGIIPQENTHILITSRCSEGWEKPALNLNVFRPEDSINYLLKVTGLNKIPENEKVAGELADELAHLPLALALAAHYIKLVGGQNASAEHFRDYLKALKEEIKKGSLIHFEEKRNLFKEPESKITYENLINRTLRISSGRLSDLAKKLMEYSAYLDSDSISKEIFLESSSSKKQVEEALTQLSSLSLIKRMHNEPLFSIHRLVQLVIRNENELKDDKKPQEIFSFMTSTFKILFEKNIKTSEQIDKLLTYLPHIIELLTHSQRLKIVSDELSYLGWIGKILDFIEWENITEILFKFNISTKTLVKDKKYINKKKHQLLKKAHFLFSDFISSFDLPNRIIQIAEQNHPRIQWVLAEISEDKKFYWLTKSAERGYAKAQCSLGSLYKDGAQIEKNYEKTVQWLTKAAEQGYAMAQFSLGTLYHDGEVVEKNYVKSVQWFTKAAEQGHVMAQCFLGLLYHKGEVVDKNYVKSVQWFTKAAEQENADAQFHLGTLYRDGEVVEKNYEKAIQWFTKAAEQGDAMAQFSLGELYCAGEVEEKNYEKAIQWLTKAAEQENADAQLMLGRMYYNGHGVKQNYEEAVTWYMKAGNQGGSEAQLSLGLMYYAGQGVERNYEKAIQWLTKVAEQGNADAQLILGRMYYTGQEVETNYEKAIQWLIKAAEQGKADAQLILGIMYYTGQGVEQSYQEAMVWFSMGAAQVPAKIQYSLGKICEKGEGVAQSYSKAADWYRKAAEQGDVKAQYRLKNVEHLKKEEEENLQKEIQLAYEASSGGTQEEEQSSFWTRWFWGNQEEEEPSYWTRWFLGNQNQEWERY